MARKLFISIGWVLAKKKEIRRAVPIIDMSEISANTEERKEYKYQEANAAPISPKRTKHRVSLTAFRDTVLRVLVSNTAKAKALESIVPIKAAMREITRKEPSQCGKTLKTPSTNRFAGSTLIPANLKWVIA